MAPNSSKIALLAAFSLAAVACGDAVAPDSAPAADPYEIHAWLEAGEYRSWESSARFEGLNGTGVRVFLNGRARRDGSQPGAIGVRELYASTAPDAELRGWSMFMKTSDDAEPGEPGANWYFYETFEPADPDAFAVADHAALACVGCHSEAPDIVRSERPLIVAE